MNLDGGRRRRCQSSSATCPRGPPATASTSGSSPASPSTTSPPTTSSSARTSWSTTTCPGCTRGWSRSRRWPRTTAGRAPACTWASARARSRQDTDDGGWQSGLPAMPGLDARTTRSARASSGCSPTSRSTSCPTTCSSSARAPRSRPHARDDLPAHAPRVDRRRDVRRGRRSARELLGHRQPRGHRDRRARPAGRRARPPFPGGRLCYRFEEPVHRFQNMVIDRMVGLRRVPPGDDEAAVPAGGSPGVAAPATCTGIDGDEARAAPKRGRGDAGMENKQGRTIDTPVFAIAAGISVAFVLVGVLFKDEHGDRGRGHPELAAHQPRLAVRALDGGIPDLRRCSWR